MGYSSDFQIAFYLAPSSHPPSDTPLLPFAALKLWFDETYPKEGADAYGAEISYGTDHILVTYYGVKWYEGYDHPKAVTTATELFAAAFGSDDSDARAHWESARIGEEYSDVEKDGSSYCEYRLEVRREIVFN